MCKCQNIEMGEFTNQIVVKNPFNGKMTGIDSCILDEVVSLWLQGIETIASCCGHNKIYGSVCVNDNSESKMHDLNYIMRTNQFGVKEFLTKSFR